MDVHAQLGVELMSSSASVVLVYFVFTCRRCLVFTFLSGLHFPHIPLTHTHRTSSPSSTTPLSHAPPFALADSPPALHSLTP